MSNTARTADGGLVIRRACPAGIEVLSAAAAGGGRWFVLSSGGTAACCWPADAEDLTGAPRYVFDWSRRPGSLALARLPGGNDVVVARSGLGKLLRWDCVSGQPAGEPVRHPALRTSPVGRLPLVVADITGGPLAITDSAEGGLRRWDAVTGQAVGEAFGSQCGAIWALAAGTLADGSPVVVSGGADRLVHCWDPVTGAERGEPIRGCGRAVAIAIIRLAVGQSVVCVLSTQGNVHRRDLLTGEPVGERVSTGWQPGKHNKVCRGLMAVTATDDGSVIATCTDYRTVRLWDLVSGAPAGELPGFAPAAIRDMAAAYLPDGTPLIVAGDSDGKVHRFDARNGRPSGKPVQPHGWSAAAVLPIAAPDGRIILAAQGRHSVGRFDARTGEAIGEPWRIRGDSYAFAAAALPDGQVVLAAAGGDGITRQEVLSGAEYPPAKASAIWDVAAATLPGGRVLIAGAGHDWLIYRWDAATGEMIGEPLAEHRLSVKAVTTARQADGAPMFVTGCENGQVLRWDAASGKRIGPPLGTPGGVRNLEVVDLPSGRQILAGLDDEGLYQWDPVTGESLGPPVKVGLWARIVAAHVDRNGTPAAFVWIPDEDSGGEEDQRVECWRLDTGTRVNTRLPGTVRAVFDDADTTWMVLGEPSGSLVIRPLLPDRR